MTERKKSSWDNPHIWWGLGVAVVIALCFLLGGCAGMEKPQTNLERIAYSEAGAQASIKTLTDLTCKQYTQAGVCSEAGRPLHPARSKQYLETISVARKGLQAAAAISDKGVGQCMGLATTQTACLQQASAMLTEITKILNDLKGAQ